MKDVWRRINKWLEGNAPQILETLQTGASDEKIHEVEGILSVKFPDDVKDSYRIHNGQSSGDVGFINGLEFLSLERIRAEWRIWKDSTNKLNTIYFSRQIENPDDY